MGGGGQETREYNRRREGACEGDALRGMDDAHLAFGEHGRESESSPSLALAPSPHSKKRNFKVSFPLGDLPDMTSNVNGSCSDGYYTGFLAQVSAYTVMGMGKHRKI